MIELHDQDLSVVAGGDGVMSWIDSQLNSAWRWYDATWPEATPPPAPPTYSAGGVLPWVDSQLNSFWRWVGS
jgi:hypothetical protein